MREISERVAGNGESGLPAHTTPGMVLDSPARGPATPIEEKLLDLARTLVKSEQMSVEDDFFLVGGHSLLGTQLVMRVRESFGVPLTLRDLFEGATVAQLAKRVEAMLRAELDAMSEEEAAKQAVK